MVTLCLSLILDFVKFMPRNERQSSRADSNLVVQITRSAIDFEKKKNQSDKSRSEHLDAIVLDRLGWNQLSKSRDCITQRCLCYFILDRENRFIRRTRHDKYGKAPDRLSLRGMFRDSVKHKPQQAEKRYIDVCYYKAILLERATESYVGIELRLVISVLRFA